MISIYISAKMTIYIKIPSNLVGIMLMKKHETFLTLQYVDCLEKFSGKIRKRYPLNCYS